MSTEVDPRGMSCLEAVVALNKPCQGVCTMRPGAMGMVIVDPDCFRGGAS